MESRENTSEGSLHAEERRELRPKSPFGKCHAWVTDEDETPSTSFTLVETTVIIEAREGHSGVRRKSDNSDTFTGFLPAISISVEENERENTGGVKAFFHSDGNKRARGGSLESNVIQKDSRFLLLPPLAVGLAHGINARDSCNPRKAFSLDERMNFAASDEVREKLLAIRQEFTKRVKRKKQKIRKPATPSSDLSEHEDDETTELHLQKRLKEFFPNRKDETSTLPNIFGISAPVADAGWKHHVQHYASTFKRIIQCDFMLEQQNKIYLCWLLLVSSFFLYNAWVVPLRSIFPCQTPLNVKYWIATDAIADLIYLVDVVIVKSHLVFESDGITTEDFKEIRRKYLKSWKFASGCICLLPVDWYFAIFKKTTPWLRIIRLIKIDTFWEMFNRFDSVLASPYPIRIARSLSYMFYLIHLYACAYYFLSSWELAQGYDTEWIFRDIYYYTFESYIRCFYFATKTATSIGKNPKPENEIEYAFMTCAWLSGVFAFAILIGQLRDIIATATKNQTEYRQLLYAITSYMRRFDVPHELQERVKLWVNYTWQQQRTLDEATLLSLLPDKLKTDIALDVHIEVLNKVKLFQHCEVAFLRDLVPRLKSVIFLPNDYVCRKGEVGKEMYIVKTGRVDVIGGSSEKEILLASLGAGSIFGEIALLQVNGMDKRTADVRSAGFSNLFLLTKHDLKEVIKDYPAAQESLKKQAKRLIKISMKKSGEFKRERSPLFQSKKQSLDVESDSEKSDVIFMAERSPSSMPKMINTVLKALPSESKAIQLLKYGSKGTDRSLSESVSISSYPPSPFLPAGGSGLIHNLRDISLSSSADSLVNLGETED